jgi:DNA helicase-2/ATP-dependent DNA helicase PcrA
MLENFVTEGSNFCPHFDLCFVDEAQDLSPMQWDIAHLLDERSKRMYVAGDDDQAIYRWAGADVDHFIGLEGGSETLSQSYRVPILIHQLAERVVSRIETRFLKDYRPKVDEYGSIRRIFSVEEIDMSEGSWLILAQAGYQLQPVAAELRSSGYLFINRGHRSISEKISDAVNGWEQLRKGKEVTGAVARKIYSYMSTKDRVKRGFKTLTAVEDTDFVTLETLTADHGLLATQDMVWHIAMDRVPESDRAYIIAMLRRGERFNGEPRITVSTIHGAKGGEADNVVLFTDLSPAAEEQMNVNPDDTHRVFYVGVTRAKQSLFIVEPQDFTRSYDL